MMTKKQNMIFTFGIMNTIMCVAMSIAALLINVGFITIPMFVVTLAEALIICNLCTVIFRIPQISVKGSVVSFIAAPIGRKIVMKSGEKNPEK